MFKLLRLAFALTIALGVLIFILRLIATSQLPPKDALVQMTFTNPDGSACDKPCIFGIYPGRPQQAEDKTRLAQYSWLKDVTLSDGILNNGWFEIAGQSASFFASDTEVWWGFEVRDDFVPQTTSFPQPTLGEIIAKFGTPSLVNWKVDALSLWYENAKMLIYCGTIDPEDDIDTLMPTTPIESVMVFSTDDVGKQQFKEIRWQGFTNVERYRVDP